MAKVTFYGACGCVTGSSTLLEWGNTRVLVDCGMYQGDEELEERNWREFPFRPAELTAVVLTHAHLDHTGLLPRLVAEGYQGPIYLSRASRGLASLILEDAGEIQEEQARYARKKGYSRHANPRPLYTVRDAKQAMRQLTPIPFNTEKELVPGVRVRVVRAGHLLGAGSLLITAKDGDGQRRTWCFSGDVGRYGVPILHDPESPEGQIDALVLESTYGDRLHETSHARERLSQIIEGTFARGGMVIIPAFALGRTQEVLYYLAELVEAGRLDPQTVFLDSPMAIDATQIYDRAVKEHDEELRELIDEGANPLASNLFQRCARVDDSKRLNSRKKPAVIVAASGMATAGRVVHHLLHRLGDPASSVVFTGYQASGTRGRALLEGADMVAIHGNQVRVRATIHRLHGLSAHADRDELLRWCRDLPGAPARVFLNHGEDPSRKALAAAVQAELGWGRPSLPSYGMSTPW